MAKLVIVESPAKAKTISKYLGKGYTVAASVGHIRDLPKSQIGVDIDNHFTPKYISIRGKAPLINDLKKQAKKSDKIFLATDPDREGEAISWHLAYVLGIDPDKALRITFNEVTKSAVQAAIKQPHGIDSDLVDAYQARRVLDRIVGYKLSPFLWKKVKPGLSAGRVQSVAVRLIVDREEEIRAFVPQEYWTLEAVLANGRKKQFKAKFYGNAEGKIELHSKEDTDVILTALKNAVYRVIKIKKGVRAKSPSPPFITSTLQQEASRKLGFQARRTMSAAQNLYEGIDIKGMGTVGLITYMRTDALRVSAEAQAQAKEYIVGKYGEQYYPKTPRVYKTRKSAQDAHEAIRPTMPAVTPEQIKKDLTADQYKMYKLIWERFIASQMESAVYDTVQADIGANGYIFKASGNTLRFDGFTVLYEESKDEKEVEAGTLPQLEEQELLELLKLLDEQHFTQPPARYTEASLIKALEENAIGRPSTYASTISTIMQRNYVKREAKSLFPTQLGEITTQLMKEHFSQIVDIDFTAHMENDLDRVEDGALNWVESIEHFYRGFESTLKKAEEELGGVMLNVPDEVTDILCEKCGKNMVVKQGRYGKFLACPGYPACKNTRQIGEKSPEEISDKVCELCGKPMAVKQGKYGKFLACTGYPACKHIVQIGKQAEGSCPKCGNALIQRRSKKGRFFYGCTGYPQCDFSVWEEPVAEKCEKCGSTLFKKKSKNTTRLICVKEGCGYERTEQTVEEDLPKKESEAD